MSLFFAVILFPLTYVLAKLFGFIIKTWNPTGYNAQSLQSPLAYLGPIVYFGLAIFTIIAALAVFTGIKGLRDSQKNVARLSLVLTAAEIILLVVLFAIQNQ